MLSGANFCIALRNMFGPYKQQYFFLRKKIYDMIRYISILFYYITIWIWGRNCIWFIWKRHKPLMWLFLVFNFEQKKIGLMDKCSFKILQLKKKLSTFWSYCRQDNNINPNIPKWKHHCKNGTFILYSIYPLITTETNADLNVSWHIQSGA